jgi:hypothetical protein
MKEQTESTLGLLLMMVSTVVPVALAIVVQVSPDATVVTSVQSSPVSPRHSVYVDR